MFWTGMLEFLYDPQRSKILSRSRKVGSFEIWGEGTCTIHVRAFRRRVSDVLWKRLCKVKHTCVHPQHSDQVQIGDISSKWKDHPCFIASACRWPSAAPKTPCLIIIIIIIIMPKTVWWSSCTYLWFKLRCQKFIMISISFCASICSCVI